VLYRNEGRVQLEIVALPPLDRDYKLSPWAAANSMLSLSAADLGTLLMVPVTEPSRGRVTSSARVLHGSQLGVGDPVAD